MSTSSVPNLSTGTRPSRTVPWISRSAQTGTAGDRVTDAAATGWVSIATAEFAPCVASRSIAPFTAACWAIRQAAGRGATGLKPSKAAQRFADFANRRLARTEARRAVRPEGRKAGTDSRTAPAPACATNRQRFGGGDGRGGSHYDLRSAGQGLDPQCEQIQSRSSRRKPGRTDF